MSGATVPPRRRARAAIRPDDALELRQRSRVLPRRGRRTNGRRRYSDDAAWACSGNLARWSVEERKPLQGLVMHMSTRPSENHCRAVTGLWPIATLPIVMGWQKNRGVTPIFHTQHAAVEGHRWSACVYEHWSDYVRAHESKSWVVCIGLAVAGASHCCFAAKDLGSARQRAAVNHSDLCPRLDIPTTSALSLSLSLSPTRHFSSTRRANGRR